MPWLVNVAFCSSARMASKGVAYNVQVALDQIGDLHGRAPMDGNAGEGAPLCDTAIKESSAPCMYICNVIDKGF